MTEQRGGGGGGRGDQRCKWIHSSDHRLRENKQFQPKHFLLRWALGAPARPSTLNICTLIVPRRLGRSERGHSRPFNSLLKRIPRIHQKAQRRTSSSEPTCLFSSFLTWETHWEVWLEAQFTGEEGDFFFLLYFLTSQLRCWVYVGDMLKWGLGCICFNCRITARWKFPRRWEGTCDCTTWSSTKRWKVKKKNSHLWII